eukprot:1309629-Amphidinium_carterae.1
MGTKMCSVADPEVVHNSTQWERHELYPLSSSLMAGWGNSFGGGISSLATSWVQKQSGGMTPASLRCSAR